MEVEKKTLIYILIGLVYISSAVAFQGGWDNSHKINYLLFGEYSSDSYPDLHISEKSEGPSYGDYFNFVYSGHYIDNTYALGDKTTLHNGIILVKPNKNYIEKKYSNIPSGSKLVISAYNDVGDQDYRDDRYCKSVNMIVNQNGKELDTFDVENINNPEKFKLNPRKSNSESNFVLEIKSNSKCSNFRQSLGVDKFYLNKTSN